MSAAAADEEIAAAVREAGEARALADAVAERVRNGGEVKRGELANARELAELAELRVDAARRRAAEAARERRARALAELAADVAAHDTAGDALAVDAATAAAALDLFVSNVNDRNAALAELRARALALDVPEHGPAVNGLRLASDGGIEHNGHPLRQLDPGPLVAGIVHRLAVEHRLSAGGGPLASRVPDLMGVWGPHDLAEYIRGRA